MEYFIRYGKGYTHIRNGENAETEYYYGEDNLIYKIVDANGGITRHQYNSFQELEVTVNPEGYTRKTAYNEFGQPVRITDENEEDTFLDYDINRNLVSLRTPGGKRLSWDYDEQDQVISRTTLSGETVKYAYEGGVLRTITDGQGRVYTLTFNERYDLELLQFPNGLFRRWEYDGRGRLVQAVDVKGNATRYAYDRTDNLIRLEEPDGNVHLCVVRGERDEENVAARAARKHGQSLCRSLSPRRRRSGEHGIGLSKRPHFLRQTAKENLTGHERHQNGARPAAYLEQRKILSHRRKQ